MLAEKRAHLSNVTNKIKGQKVRFVDDLVELESTSLVEVKAAAEQAIRGATGRPGQVTCRCTHVYPDGPAPYFSFHALGRHSALIEQWQTIKTAASDAVIIGGSGACSRSGSQAAIARLAPRAKDRHGLGQLLGTSVVS